MKINESWYQKPEGISERICAGGVVARCEGNQVLVGFAREKGYRDYVLPKGHMEVGEEIEGTARREIEEELGISDLYLVSFLGVMERLNFTKTDWKVTHYFLFTTKQKNVIPSQTEQHPEMDWFSLNELPDLFWPEQKAFLKKNRNMILNLLCME